MKICRNSLLLCSTILPHQPQNSNAQCTKLNRYWYSYVTDDMLQIKNAGQVYFFFHQETVTLLRTAPVNTQVSLLICRPDNGVLPPVNKLVSTVDEALNSPT